MSRGRALALGIFAFLGSLLIVVVLFSGNASATDSGPLEYVGDMELADAVVAGECTGSGTEADTYVFADYEFDCTGSSYGLWIKDTASYVTISNCTFSNCTTTVGDVQGYAIYLQNAYNVTVSACTFSNCNYGIAVYQGGYDTLVNNTIISPLTAGIFIHSSYWVETQGNLIDAGSSTPIYGIYVQETQYLAVNDTEVAGCTYGVSLNGCDSVIIDNVTLDQQVASGINLDQASNVTITNSTFTNAGDYGYGINGQQLTSIWIQNNILDIGGGHAQGIALSICDHISIVDNQINDTVYSIFLTDAENATVESNLCTNASDYNMRLTIHNGRVIDNTIYNTPFGLSFMNCLNVTVLSNNVSVAPSFGSEGMNLYQCQNMLVEDNIIDFATGEFNKPIFLTGSSNCQIVNNTITGPANTGIAVYSGTNILILRKPPVHRRRGRHQSGRHP